MIHIAQRVTLEHHKGCLQRGKRQQTKNLTKNITIRVKNQHNLLYNVVVMWIKF